MNFLHWCSMYNVHIIQDTCPIRNRIFIIFNLTFLFTEEGGGGGWDRIFHFPHFHLFFSNGKIILIIPTIYYIDCHKVDSVLQYACPSVSKVLSFYVYFYYSKQYSKITCLFFKPVIFTLWKQAKCRFLLQGKKLDIWNNSLYVNSLLCQTV